MSSPELTPDPSTQAGLGADSANRQVFIQPGEITFGYADVIESHEDPELKDLENSKPDDLSEIDRIREIEKRRADLLIAGVDPEEILKLVPTPEEYIDRTKKETK